MRHLVGQGYAPIGYLGWPHGSPVGDDRRSGWAATTTELGIHDLSLQEVSPQDSTEAADAVKSLITQVGVGGAIVCASDTLALAAYQAARDQGLRPGTDIGLMGFDDTDTAQVFGLTSQQQPLEQIARTLLSYLAAVDAGAGPPAHGAVFDPVVIPRQSTALLVDAAGIFIMKQFFDSVSVSIEEAARMDGAWVFRTFWSVVLPMARPSLITLTILSFQGSWNEFTHTHFLVVTQSPELKTMITGLASLTSGELGAGTQLPLKMGAALLTTIPVALIFLAFQRHFVRGANEGGEKGRAHRQLRARTALATSHTPRIATTGPMTAQSVTPDMTLPPSTSSP